MCPTEADIATAACTLNHAQGADNGRQCADPGREGEGKKCWELTTLWVARLNDGAELKVTDPEEQQGDVEEEKAKGEERRDRVDC